MPRPRHPDRDVEAAVSYAEAHGWEFVRVGSHVWGILRCPTRPGRASQVGVLDTPQPVRARKGHPQSGGRLRSRQGGR